MLSVEELKNLSTDSLLALAHERSSNTPDETIAVLEQLAERSHESEEYESMADWYQQLAQYADDLGNHSVKGRALYKVGFARFLEDRYPEAIAFYLEAEEIFSESFNDDMYLECLRARMDSYFADDKYGEAIKVGEELLSKSLSSENFLLAGNSALVIAQSYSQLNSESFFDLTDSLIESARHYGLEAKKYFENSGDVSSLSEVTSFLADLDIDEEPSLRLASIQESIDLLLEKKRRTSDEEYELANRIETRGRIRFRLNDFDGAEADFKSALDRFDFIDEEVSYSLAGDRAVCYWQLAQIQLEKRDFREAQLTLNSALNHALISANTEFYYRLLEDLSWAQLQSDNHVLALRVCNDAIEKYEESEDKPFGSYIYCGFLIQKAIILVVFELWKEALNTLEKINSIDDYLVSMNRVVRIEALRAKALHGLGRIDESLEILNATLSEVTEEVVSEEDIADCYALRGQILLSRNDRSGVGDLKQAKTYFHANDYHNRVTELDDILASE